MQSESQTGCLQNRLRLANLSGAKMVAARGAADHFGDMEVIFQLHPLMLRIVRERGQEFLSIAPVSDPDRFFQFTDIEIAMGWRTVNDVLAKGDPEPLECALARLRDHLDELAEALSGDRATYMGEQIERAAKMRGDAFVARLREQRK